MKQLVLCIVLLLTVLLELRTVHSADVRDDPRFQVPEHFAVEAVYAPERSGSVIAINFDSRGRLVMAKEQGPIVTLLDPEEDGTYEERAFTDQVTNCQGMVFDGLDLLAVGAGPEGAGLYRIVDENGDARGDRVEIITLATSEMREHGPHAVFFGPDGYLYWALGNDTGIQPSPAPLSPYRNYVEGSLTFLHTDPRGRGASRRAPGGVILRKDLQAPHSDWERVAGGFRNQYDGGFNLAGELFTFDSDMEADLNLPWYRPVRSVHVVPGGEYGWRTGARKWPAYYPDNLPPMTEVGRGSPTGIAFYQHHVYPETYRDAFLQADWSRGRILVGRLKRSGATYTQVLQEFVLGMPLNVTDMAVGPGGAVYFSLGGRRTEGGIYRVVYEGPSRQTEPQPRSPIEEALAQPQPRSAWGRARAARLREGVGAAAWERALKRVIEDAESPPERRVRALELLQVFGPAPEEALLIALRDDARREVRAASTYYLALHQTDTARRELVRRLRDADPMVRRRAAEALVRSGIHPALEAPLSPVKDLFPLLGEEDRFVRYAIREALKRVNRNGWREEALALDEYPQATEALLALVQTAENTHDIPFLLQRELELLRERPSDAELLGLLRVIELTLLQDAGVEYPQYGEIGELLLERFPTVSASLNRELARVLAYLQTPGAIGEILAELLAPKSDQEQQIFYAYTLSAFSGGWEDQQEESLIGWFESVRAEEWKGGAAFTGYLGSIWNDFLAHMPEEGGRLATERVPSLSPQMQEGSANAPAFQRNGYTETVSEKEIYEYLLYDPVSYRGDPAAGAAAFEKAFCSSCHRFGPLGRGVGPDLTTVGRRFQRKDLLEAILYPSETISDQWATEEIIKKNGETLTGNVYREDAQAVTLSVTAGPQVTILKSEIASRTRSSTSSMPEGLMNNLTRQEMKELLLFLEGGVEALPDSLN